MTTADTPDGIEYYRLAAVKGGLKALKRGMRVNSSYTHDNLKALVEAKSGKKFQRRDYDSMIGAVEELMEVLLKKATDQDLLPDKPTD